MGLIRLIDDITSYLTSDIKKQTGKGFLQTFLDTGNYGEFRSYKYLFMTPGKRDFIHNCYLPVEKGLTEIDLLMIHETGLYVVESKNYSGWIFGDENQKEWTQVLAGGRKKSRFYNPVWQNAGHIKALRTFFSEYQDLPVFSLVVFSERCELKKITYQSENVFVMKRNQLKSVFKKQIQGKDKCSSEVMADIYQRLLPLCKKDTAEKQQHIDRINSLKSSPDGAAEITGRFVPTGDVIHSADIGATGVIEIQEQSAVESFPNNESANDPGLCPRCGAA